MDTVISLCIVYSVCLPWRGRRGYDRMVVGFTTTYAISASNVVSSNPRSGEVNSIQQYVINFVSDLRQVGGFLRVLSYLPIMKLTTTIYLKYC